MDDGRAVLPTIEAPEAVIPDPVWPSGPEGLPDGCARPADPLPGHLDVLQRPPAASGTRSPASRVTEDGWQLHLVRGRS